MFGNCLIDSTGAFRSLSYPMIRYPTLDVMTLESEAVLFSSSVSKTRAER
jgi:hypothetical protein